jgi:hypothetical protein
VFGIVYPFILLCDICTKSEEQRPAGNIVSDEMGRMPMILTALSLDGKIRVVLLIPSRPFVGGGSEYVLFYRRVAICYSLANYRGRRRWYVSLTSKACTFGTLPHRGHPHEPICVALVVSIQEVEHYRTRLLSGPCSSDHPLHTFPLSMASHAAMVWSHIFSPGRSSRSCFISFVGGMMLSSQLTS